MSAKSAIGLLVIVFILIYLGTRYGARHEQGKSQVEKLAEGPKRYIIYNKNQFKRPAGMQMNAAIASQAVEVMPEINGAILHEIPKDLPSDWVVEEENHTYHTMQLTGCSETLPSPTPDCAPKPTAQPCTNCPPDGTPQPSATPSPGGRTPLFGEYWVGGVHASQAQDMVDTSKITICVIDTGIDMQHEYLRGRIAGSASMLGGTAQDDQGHGTHVAGIVTTVSRANVYMVKALDRNGSGTQNWIANAEVHCADKGMKIISMSLGSEQYDGIIAQATKYAQSKGAIVVAAAGNNGGAVGYPAALPGVLAISAIDRYNRPASFTSHGPQVAFASFGVDVKSARLGGGAVSMSGTSMATPNAAAVLSFALAANKKMMKGVYLNIGKEYEGNGLADAWESAR